MPQPTSFDRQFIELILEIDKHVGGYIDAYIGPPEMKQEAASRPVTPPLQLLSDCARLRDNIPNADPDRQAYLIASLRAAETTVRTLSGEEIPYMEEVQRIYDIMPQRVDEQVFLQAHKELDTYLPGSGSLASRLESWRSQYHIPNEKLLPALQLLAAETRKRTKDLVDLPQHESIEIAVVNDEPWSAYNWFKGNGRSLIEFNTDIPKSVLGLLSTMAHEAYPGHHTESTIKEEKFWLQRGYGEAAAMLLHSPAAVIAEGIATTSTEIIFPDRQELPWTIDQLMPTIPMAAQETVEQIRHIEEAMQKMRWLSGNAAILFHTGQLSTDLTIEYLQTYGLSTPQRAQKTLSFITHPLYRSYPFTYTMGYELIGRASPSADKTDVFLNCLTGQVLPSQLAARGAKPKSPSRSNDRTERRKRWTTHLMN